MTQIEDGFVSLFDGTPDSAARCWRGYKKDALPKQWAVQDGLLTLTSPGAGDIVSKATFTDFDLRLDWKISPGGNSGIFYRITEEGENTKETFQTGLEMQVLDDAAHADAKNGRSRLAGALYDMYEMPDPSPVRPAGEWNAARIVMQGNRIEHYTNGVKTLACEMGTDDWKKHLAASKFGQMEEFKRFATVPTGHFGLQDHGNVVSYRNIRVKSL